MVRESFVHEPKFYQAMMAILRKMNNATANYWKLDLAIDDERGRYVIFDRGCVVNNLQDIDKEQFYRFNEGVHGELLGFSFDASYTAEAKAAVLLSAHKPNAVGVKDQNSINGPDLHAQTLNHVVQLPALDEEVDFQRRKKADQRSRRSPRDAFPFETEAERIQAEKTAKGKREEAEEKRRQAEEDRIEKLVRFFDDSLRHFVARSNMKTLIQQDGVQRNAEPNNYIAPIPTEINMNLRIQGIGGLTFFDAFLVSKLPKIYERHGVFVINSLSHDISSDGWFTNMGGLYYFLFHDPASVPDVVEPAEPISARVPV
jgi:hypothetical protein